MLGKIGESMKTADKLMVIGVAMLLLFGVMLFGAITGEIRESISRVQVTTIMEYAMIPLFIAAITLIPACLMPTSLRPN